MKKVKPLVAMGIFGCLMLSALTGCVSTPKPTPEQFIERSAASLHKGQWVEAMGWASVAISSGPERWEPYVSRARAYCELGYYDKAIEDCHKALEVDPNNGAAYNNRGMAYQKKGDYDRAKDSYNKACDVGLAIGCNNLNLLMGDLVSKPK